MEGHVHEQRALEELRGRFVGGESSSSVDDSMLRCFLRVRDWDVDKSARLLQDHLKWRAEHLPVPSQDFEAVSKLGRMSFVGSGASGHPVCMLNFKNLLEVDWARDDEVQRHVHAMVHLAEEMVASMPEGVDQWVSICNCVGIAAPPQAFLQQMSEVFKQNYPERVHKIVIYPVPRLIVQVVNSFLWFLPERTRGKFVFVDNLQLLCEHTGLAMEQLPSELTAGPEEAPLPPGTVQLEVAAGATETHRLPLSAGAVVSWDVHTVQHDVIVGLRYVPAGNESKSEQVLEPARVRGKGGLYTVQADGVMEFFLDNSFSYFNQKTVIIRVQEQEQDCASLGG